MTHGEAVERYLGLTDQIKKLSDERAALKTYFHNGRNAGTDRDIRVNAGMHNRIDMALLRRYVTPTVIDMCMVTKYSHSVAVVPKLKPRKEKTK